MKKAVVSIRNLSKTFHVRHGLGLKGVFRRGKMENIKALRGVSFDISEGEFLALLGPNGAGKSTLIKILIGVLAYDKGKVSVLGQEPLDNREDIISQLGIVFGQRSRMWYDLPVRESFELTKRLYIEGYPRSFSREQKEWEEFLIERIEIRPLLSRQVKKLSLGEKMRCELVNTLLYNPDLIFLDEPTIGLDVVSKQKIRETLRLLHKEGKTILLTSHDTVDIEKLCERVIVINHGKVVVDLSMKKFMKLSDETLVYFRFKKKVAKTVCRDIPVFSNTCSVTSDYELEFKVPEKKTQELVKTMFDRFEIADVKIKSEGVESILVSLYNK